MSDHTPRAVFDAHRAEIERQVEVILADRAGMLGRRAVLAEFYGHDDGKHLADVVRTTHGPVVVTYGLAADRVTGDRAAVVPLTDEADQQLTLTPPYPALRLAPVRTSLARGTRKFVLHLDADAWADKWLRGFSADADPLARAVSRRNRFRASLRQKRIRGFSAESIARTERDLQRAETAYEHVAAAHEEQRRAHRERRNQPRG